MRVKLVWIERDFRGKELSRRAVHCKHLFGVVLAACSVSRHLPAKHSVTDVENAPKTPTSMHSDYRGDTHLD